jgi:hypothetical protein
MGQSFDRCDHVFLVASVIAETAYQHVRAIGEVTFPAGDASAVLSSMPTHTDALTLFPPLHAGADRVHDAGDLVPGDARIGDPWKQAFFCEHVTVAYTACLNSNPDLSWSRLGDVTFDEFEVSTRSGYLHCLHRSHPRLLVCFSNFKDVRMTSPHAGVARRESVYGRRLDRTSVERTDSNSRREKESMSDNRYSV